MLQGLPVAAARRLNKYQYIMSLYRLERLLTVLACILSTKVGLCEFAEISIIAGILSGGESQERLPVAEQC